MPLGLDPKIDVLFKKIFASPESIICLIDLLQAILGKTILGVELLNPFNLKEATAEKEVILDIKARLSDGKIVTVEMQMLVRPIYVRRAVYYWARTYSKQLGEGDSYAILQPVIAIHILKEPMFPGVPGYHRSFGMISNDASRTRLSDDFELHTIELSKFNLTAEQVQTPLEQWCYFLKHGSELEPLELPQSIRREPIQKAVEVVEFMAQNTRERELYEARLKAWRDAESLRADSFIEGKSEGKMEGMIASTRRYLERRFGSSALSLMNRLTAIQDPVLLEEIQGDLYSANSVPEIEELLAKHRC